MLEIISENNEEDVFETLLFFSTPEINVATSDDEKFELVENFKQNSNFENAEIIDIDGIRVNFESGWGLLRASNTSPVLVLRFEAESEEYLEEIKNSFYLNLKKLKKELQEF